MKRIISKFSAALVIIAALSFLISGTASAHTAAPTHQIIPVSAHVALACPATVEEGSSGSTVKTLQTALNSLYEDYSNPYFYEASPDAFTHPLAVDGSFGPQTLYAVIDFQTWNSPAFGGTLVVDGQVGPKTWHDLGKC